MYEKDMSIERISEIVETSVEKVKEILEVN